MRNSILYFFFLVLRVSCDLTPDIVYKKDWVSKTFP